MAKARTARRRSRSPSKPTWRLSRDCLSPLIESLTKIIREWEIGGDVQPLRIEHLLTDLHFDLAITVLEHKSPSGVADKVRSCIADPLARLHQLQFRAAQIANDTPDSKTVTIGHRDPLQFLIRTATEWLSTHYPGYGCADEAAEASGNSDCIECLRLGESLGEILNDFKTGIEYLRRTKWIIESSAEGDAKNDNVKKPKAPRRTNTTIDRDAAWLDEFDAHNPPLTISYFAQSKGVSRETMSQLLTRARNHRAESRPRKRMRAH
jgi:hypothetical protein